VSLPNTSAYDPATGALVGAALDTAGVPIAIDGLWALVFGNDTAGAPHNRNVAANRVVHRMRSDGSVSPLS